MRTVKWITLLAVVSAFSVLSAEAWSKGDRIAPRGASGDPAETRDRTQFDCREVVGRTITRANGRNGYRVRVDRECPHPEQMAAGLCESHWFKGMRCVE